jgi:hypothetical protein
MASTSNRTDLPIKKQKPLKGAAGKAAKISNEYIMPKNASDVAMYLIPYGKVARAVGGIAKKGSKYVAKVYRNIG